MSDPVEHVSVWPGGHEEYRAGTTCDECEQRLAEKRALLNSGSPTIVNGAGPSSLNPKIAEFWETGDPEGL